jgi:phage terminase large subunit-like protein
MTDIPLTPSERRRALEFVAYRQKYHRLAYFIPYPKQAVFLLLGASKRERLLMAGNRVGKTETGAYEAALHATGDYPSDWKGKRFDHPTIGWVCGQTSLAVRDICQAKLLGSPGVVSAQGTGMLPKDSLVDTSLARGVTDAIDTVQVRHVSGGISIIRFKSYEQGRQKFQGEGLDWIWFDEEPDIDLYAEGMTRIGEKNGIAWMTFTPLLGRSAVVLRFTDEPSPDRELVMMSIDDIPPDGHISPEAKKKIIEGYLPHEREARSRGQPILGEGRIFTTVEAAIVEPPITHIPYYWKKLWGIDFGIGHPFAAVLILWDVDNDVVHVHSTIRMADALVIVQAAAMKKIAIGVPVAWPRDGTERDPRSGEPLSKAYKDHGLKMLAEHATWPEGGMSTEAGIEEMDEREKTGRLKYAAHLSDLLEERRFYHRKNGQIVKIKDDILSALRIAIMMKRFARAVPLGAVENRPPNEGGGLARNVDFDLF